MEFENSPTPSSDFDHVAFEIIRVIGSIEELNKKYGKLDYALRLAREALSEIDDAEVETAKTIN